MELLFTYGTLMKGQKAHNSYPDMSYISDAVLPDYGLYEASEENYPCAVSVKGFNVSGEVILLMKKFLKNSMNMKKREISISERKQRY